MSEENLYEVEIKEFESSEESKKIEIYAKTVDKAVEKVKKKFHSKYRGHWQCFDIVIVGVKDLHSTQMSLF